MHFQPRHSLGGTVPAGKCSPPLPMRVLAAIPPHFTHPQTHTRTHTPALQGQVVKAVIVETKKEVQRKDGRCARQQGAEPGAAASRGRSHFTCRAAQDRDTARPTLLPASHSPSPASCARWPAPRTPAPQRHQV